MRTVSEPADFTHSGAVARLRRARPAESGRITPSVVVGTLVIEDAREHGDGWTVRESRHAPPGVRGLHEALTLDGIDAGRLVAGSALLLGVRPTPLVAPSRMLFLDLETTGLGGAGTLAWCVGLAWIESQQIIVEQHLLSSPSGEAELLARVDDRIAAADLIVTFNGRSFDLPLLDARRVMQRRGPRRPLADLDLLPPARRVFGAADARLSALETRLGRPRSHDIAGADIPRAWFDWLRYGATGPIRRAVDHNREDLLAMVALLSWILAVAAGEARAEALADPLALAEIRLADGDRDAALAAFMASPAPPPGSRARRRARLARRLLGRAGSRLDWQRLVDAGDPSVLPWEMLAKILEHDDGDPAAALALISRARSIVPAGPGSARLARRRARLEAKVRPVPLIGRFHVDCARPSGSEPPGSEWRYSPSDTPSGRSLRSARS